jgi:hypothetical protein
MKIGFFLGDSLLNNEEPRGMDRSLVKLLICIKHQYKM